MSSARYCNWGGGSWGVYGLLLIVIAIIFFTTSILFNSLKQPLAIIFVIPISYIGVFLTFYLFGLNFDQGGFIPFMVGTGKEAFWFPLAVGTVGGLVMSIVGIFVFLPIFTLKKHYGVSSKQKIDRKRAILRIRAMKILANL